MPNRKAILETLADQAYGLLEKLNGFVGDIVDAQNAKPVEGVKEEDDLNAWIPTKDDVASSRSYDVPPHDDGTSWVVPPGASDAMKEFFKKKLYNVSTTDEFDERFLWDNEGFRARTWDEVVADWEATKDPTPENPYPNPAAPDIKPEPDAEPETIAKANGSYAWVPTEAEAKVLHDAFSSLFDDDAEDLLWDTGDQEPDHLTAEDIANVASWPKDYVDSHDSPYGAGEVAKRRAAEDELLNQDHECDETCQIDDVLPDLPDAKDVDGPTPGLEGPSIRQTAYLWEKGLSVYLLGDSYRHNKVEWTFDEYLDQVITFLVGRYTDDRFYDNQVAGEVAESLGDFAPGDDTRSLKDILEEAAKITTQLGPDWLQK